MICHAQVLNQSTGVAEICDTQSAMNLLGNGSEVSSHEFTYLHAWAAVNYQNSISRTTRCNDVNNDTVNSDDEETLSSDENSTVSNNEEETSIEADSTNDGTDASSSDENPTGNSNEEETSVEDDSTNDRTDTSSSDENPNSNDEETLSGDGNSTVSAYNRQGCWNDHKPRF